MENNQGKEVKEFFDLIKTDRSNWDNLYQILGEYISLIKQDFLGQPSRGEFLIKDVFDSTGAFAAYNAASTLLGMLWPGKAEQAIQIKPVDDLPQTKEIAFFFERMNSSLFKAMDDPKANLSNALDEYMLEQMIFGTSGIAIEKGKKSKLLYTPHGVKNLYIDEGENGLVDVVALYYEWTAKRIVNEYGEANVSTEIAKAYKANRTQDRFKILRLIRARQEPKAEKGKLSMPYESIHIEYQTCHVLREGGFEEFPLPVCRFRKLNYEKMGRSCGMNAIPDIKEANFLREAVIIATEKALNMPQGVIDDGMLGGGYIDTSAGAVTVFNAANNVSGMPPIFDIGTPPDIRSAEKRLEVLEDVISRHFNIDRLLDFNNDVRMTFGEAQIRDQIRTASLAGLFSRQISELFTPLIERSVNILWREGEFGVIPGSEEEQERLIKNQPINYLPEAIIDRLEKGEDIYEITYKTKAANATKAEEYVAILDVMGIAGQMVNLDPSIAQRINMHESLKHLSIIRGLPVGILRQDDEFEEIMTQQQEQVQQQQMLQTADVAAGLAEKMARTKQINAQAEQ